MKQNTRINNILYIVILIFIVLLICIKAIDLHKNIIENFDEHDNNNEENNQEKIVEEKMLNNLSEIYNESDNNNNNNNNNNNTNIDMTDEELSAKCSALKKNMDFGSIVSKYSGKVFNIEKEPNSTAGKIRYIIKWQPMGGKNGGCVTANADGSYSTPICNSNLDKQLWEIIEIKDEEQFSELIKTIGGEDRLKMGRPLDETNYPFHIVKANKYDYVLNYEGGGLSVRKLANYDSQKWDVSTETVKQDPIATQNNNKYSSLTPGHNMSKDDVTHNMMANPINNGKNSDALNFNINLDPDLLKKLLNDNLGVDYNNSNNSNNSNYNNNSNVYDDDFYVNSEKNKYKRGINNETASSMLINREECEDCGEIPERFIRKDLVKSMCPGCNNLDNVET